ncbi:hypothetical protein DAH66_05130 [Sphingomonas koreensis]|uniref:Uncharacterized protein n=1 Tax=Sphingomonas koreensis TaxID=93064 RepID=A0A430G7H1_9SPHN|nr:hypothetical protein [Sphingomonas koreensis]RSY88830.1 hypothetical protein DAH66_05130 [Sphingomonas koreensis]
MNAIATEADFTHAALHSLEPGVPDSTRYDGWTAEKQKRFLVALSLGHTVTRACAIVDMSPRSAYSLRNAARGAAFRLGWDAALLHARDVLADELMERAFNGVRTTVTADDGRTVTRHRHDNVLAFRMLSRLDRRADAACTDANAAAVRLAAADFEQLLDLVARDAAPARAGLFLAARLGAAGAEASQDDLAPIRTLARADRWLRTHTDIAEPLDTADLDPADRANWTAEQWVRAEAAGLVQLAPPEPAAAHEPRESSIDRELRELHELDAANRAQRVWWCGHMEAWRTNFPPPDGFDGEEESEPDYEDYERELTEEEADAVAALRAREMAPFIASGLAERDAWLAMCRGEGEAGAPWQRDGEERVPAMA